MNAEKNSSYIRFLQYIDALESKSTENKLDAIEKSLLDQVMKAYSAGVNILVGDLLVFGHIGSQATLHGRVKSLIANGYIKSISDAVDGRKKNITPTKLALKHYENLSKLFDKAVAG
jgi:hypothetical protein